MSRSLELSRAGVLAFLPVLLVQGRRVRRTTERLPEATTRTGRVGTGADPLRVLVVGDSVAAGVGVADHADTMAGRLAAHLHARTGRPVAWEVVARSGLDAGGVAVLVTQEDPAPADVVLVSVGVNDVKDLRSDTRWRTGLARTLTAVCERSPTAQVFLLGLPPVASLPALPRPLADLLGARGRRLDRLGAEVASGFPTVTRVELGLDDLDATIEPFATDGFHPGPDLHDLLARHVAERWSGATG